MSEEEYMKMLKKLAKEKYAALKSEQYLVRKKKTMDYLVQKGFEQSLVATIVNSITDKKKSR